MHMSVSEILVILLVALLVIKPERLPETARILGRWLQKLRTLTTKIKREIEKPLRNPDELK